VPAQGSSNTASPVVLAKSATTTVSFSVSALADATARATRRDRKCHDRTRSNCDHFPSSSLRSCLRDRRRTAADEPGVASALQGDSTAVHRTRTALPGWLGWIRVLRRRHSPELTATARPYPYPLSRCKSARNICRVLIPQFRSFSSALFMMSSASPQIGINRPETLRPIQNRLKNQCRSVTPERQSPGGHLVQPTK